MDGLDAHFQRWLMLGYVTITAKEMSVSIHEKLAHTYPLQLKLQWNVILQNIDSGGLYTN